MIERRVDGVAILTFGMEETLIEHLRFRKVPLVFVDVGPDVPGIANIRINYQNGIRQAVQHLAALRHTRIAFITGPVHLKSALPSGRTPHSCRTCCSAARTTSPGTPAFIASSAVLKFVVHSQAECVMRSLRLVDVSCIEYSSSQDSAAFLAVRILCMNKRESTEEKHCRELVDESHSGFELSLTKVDNVSEPADRKGMYRFLDRTRQIKQYQRPWPAVFPSHIANQMP